MRKRTISYFVTASLLLITSCGPLQSLPVPSTLVMATSGSSLPLRKIRSNYQGPINITIDPAFAAKQSGFKIKGAGGGFRITAKSTGTSDDDHDKGLGNSGGSDADNPGHSQGDNGNHFGQQRRRAAWMIEHPSNEHHANDTLGAYFNPADASSLSGLQIDPALGEVPSGPVSNAIVSFGTDPEHVDNHEVVSGYIALEPTSDAAFQQILTLTGATNTGNVTSTLVSLKLDLSKVDVSRLPDYIRAVNQYAPTPITAANFSSVNICKTFTVILMLLAEHQDLVKELAVGFNVGGNGTIPVDTQERPSLAKPDHSQIDNQNVRDAWRYGLGSYGNNRVRVAVIDRGFIDPVGHPELSRCINTSAAKRFEYVFLNPFWVPAPIQWGPSFLFDPGSALHGTGVALAGFSDINNAHGGLGVAPNAEVIPLAVGTTSFDIARAAEYAIDVLNADVINISLSHMERGYLGKLLDPRKGVAKKAASKNIAYVTTAANDWGQNIDDTILADPEFAGAIVVGAAIPKGTDGVDRPQDPQSPSGTTSAWTKAAYSNVGTRVDIFAQSAVPVAGNPRNASIPGSNDYSIAKVDDITVFNGTSACAPQVSATAALILGAVRRVKGDPAFRFPMNSTTTIKGLKYYLTNFSPQNAVNGGAMAPLLDVNAAVEHAVQDAATAKGMTTSSYQMTTHEEGLLTAWVSGTNPNSEVGHFIYNGAHINHALSEAANNSYSRVGSGGLTRNGNTYVRVYGWPTGVTGQFDVYRVEALPMKAPVISSIKVIGSEIVVAGQYLVPNFDLNIIGFSPIRSSFTNAACTEARFVNPGLSSGSYNATIATGITSSSGGIPSGSASFSVAGAPSGGSGGSGGSGSGWTIRFFNVDDYSYVYLHLNGVLLDANMGPDRIYNLDNFLVPGYNTMELKAVNFGGGYNWGFEIKHNGVTQYYNKSNGTAGSVGANGNDQATGNVFSDAFAISI